MKRRFTLDRVFDKVHRGLVWGCVGLTIYGLALVGLRVHRYYTVLVPLGEERRRQRELELLAEGAEQTEAAYVPAPPADSAEELKY